MVDCNVLLRWRRDSQECGSLSSRKTDQAVKRRASTTTGLAASYTSASDLPDLQDNDPITSEPSWDGCQRDELQYSRIEDKVFATKGFSLVFSPVARPQPPCSRVPGSGFPIPPILCGAFVIAPFAFGYTISHLTEGARSSASYRALHDHW